MCYHFSSSSLLNLDCNLYIVRLLAPAIFLIYTSVVCVDYWLVRMFLLLFLLFVKLLSCLYFYLLLRLFYVLFRSFIIWVNAWFLFSFLLLYLFIFLYFYFCFFLLIILFYFFFKLCWVLFRKALVVLLLKFFKYSKQLR